MDLVLGLSMTSSTVRWVLVEGTTGEGATVDRGSFDFDAAVDPDDLLNVALADVSDSPIHAMGVTWTNEAEDVASGVLSALIARGYDNAIAISELEAGDVLAAGIAEIADYADVAVCIVEPDAAVVAMVNGEGVTVDRIARPLDGADVVELPSSVIAMLELNEWRPQAVFVVGSARDVDLVTSTLGDVTDSPVFSAAEADLALARGAALAAARAVNRLDAKVAKRPSKIGALASVLAAAVVTFVVSTSAAVGLSLTGDRQSADQQEDPVTVAEETAQKIENKVEGKKATTPAEARPVVAQTIAVAAPPPPAAPVVEPVYEPPAYIPPAAEYTAPEPAYTPPVPPEAPPAYTPPPVYAPPPAPAYVPPPQKPRLRDRIIERIPIINRFHEPEYPYGR
ncbi:hypothetical protein [Mycobacterium sp. 852002-51961_SCH5331710]|uniref:DUF7159 family protein n=1 Tax=Mycobacterium sp. 852002-51961_SCH5331710 TaxID=1834105 RepID=UPI0008010EC4|nr:hypothetical protein [Mycobacterium sp. 852002-51961_SCH5331710]OBB45611.1 hypothetical protein A5752_01895 [Mycobacterium sp. 852002-51961_SCH5331710]